MKTINNYAWQVRSLALLMALVTVVQSRAADPISPKGGSDIDIDTLTQFHLSMKGLCVHPSITVQYRGTLGKVLKQSSALLNMNSSPATQSSWSIIYAEKDDALPQVIARVSVSYKDDVSAEYKYIIGNRTLFVAVTPETLSKDRNEKMFSKSAFVELQNLTINELIKKLEWKKK